MKSTMTLALLLLTISPCAAADLARVQVSTDGKGFVTESGRPFIPWGFNYDHDEQGRLIEDYWDEEWPKIESDFQEMKSLGANVVRIRLRTGKFMASPDKPNERSLALLKRLVTLAEETGLYLDLTGLGCYHKADLPEWYDAMSERDRWVVQARFWEAVAKTCKGSPAVFCYDLMNEPVVPGGKSQDWLGPPLGDKHFVQRIGRDLAGRDRPKVARQWFEMLTKAIRKHDQQTLVTVGLLHWSLDLPGLKSGFVPEKITDSLDFLCVHLYPESGKLDEALETLKGFAAAGKPVVIEETFVLKCSADELSEFIDRAEGLAAGWIGFYWGTPPEELQPPKNFPEAFMLNWLELFQEKTPQSLGRVATVAFRQGDGTLGVAIGGQPVAEYVFQDDEVQRPYFRHLRTRSGVQVTRNNPPVKGQDLDDHPTMHPGLCLAFGDLDGADFWRNKGQVRHVRFLEQPKGGAGIGSFTVRTVYEADGRTLCTEDCEIVVTVRPDGWLLEWTSAFRSEQGDFTFGDQEEMGLGVRVATPLAVVKGGSITDSEGRRNESQVWGKQAEWCEYGGVLDGRHVGVVLMPHPQNFRRSWFHARDYGLLVGNPFGQSAFTKGEPSRVTVKKGNEFRLRFGVLIYGVTKGETPDIAAVFRKYAGK